ncbi:hypothetical protein [Pseudomonas sp. NW5]|uniref:hypothetical protein n=1 Tax=Pseudomonas sp. NW5 TaxID=2934934 RepID=UPI00201FF46C|nr:hypothetical protein [Pseudomonas sp. NW5]MCL7463155.1 hypothetical protein [Pseudomonas sp. NW5]
MRQVIRPVARPVPSLQAIEAEIEAYTRQSDATLQHAEQEVDRLVRDWMGE